MLRTAALRWRARWTAAIALALGLGACGGSPELPVTSPFYGSTLSPYDASVRHHLLEPDDAGLSAIRKNGPDDEVVRLMNEGLYLHRLGRFVESNAALQRAEAISDDRYTKNLGQSVASFIVSDNVVDYYASALERSLIHYYGMFNYLALGDSEGALVEARKVNALLRRYANDNPGRSFVNDAAVQYLAGMLQWGERDENASIVSLRQSLAGYEDYEKNYGVRTPQPVALSTARIASAVGLDDVAEQARARHLGGLAADTAEPARAADSGDVLILIENGFIAHKRQQKLFVPVLKSERDSVFAGSAGSAVEAAVRVLIRTVIVMNELSREGQTYVQAHEDGVAIMSGALSAVGLELITMAWPVYELSARRATGLRVTGPGGESVTPVLIEDLSAIAVRDFEERKTSMLLRMIARSLLKEAAVMRSERAGEKAGGALGGLAARIAARTVANTTERADTRSWSGLPAELLLVQMRLPAGRNQIQLSYQGLTGPETRTLEVDVVAGSVSMQTVAVVGRDGGDQGRFRAATRNVKHEVPRTPRNPRRR